MADRALASTPVTRDEIETQTPDLKQVGDSIPDVAERSPTEPARESDTEVVLDLRPAAVDEFTIELNVVGKPTSVVDPDEPSDSNDPGVRRFHPDLAPTPVRGLAVASPLALGTKRLLDVVVSGTLLVVLLPVLVIIAVLVKLTSPGPVFYRSRRIGKDGKPFSFVKFRTMREGAEDEKVEMIAQNEQDGPVFKIRSDPRITSLGVFLRKASLDELPQLAHVLSGRMSLVGPRPPLPAEVARYTPRERQRLAVKPGLTCIWQVSGRSDVGFDNWVEMDLEYIRSWSVWLDIKLLAQTIPAVISGRGAY